MSITVALPALGESVVEGTLTRWLVKVGDRVEADQPLCEITTEKVDTELPAPQAGVVEALLVNEGDTVPVGAPLCRLGEGAAASPEAVAKAAVPPRSTPSARRAAIAEGVDLSAVAGSGARGRVTRGDVEHSSESRSRPAVATVEGPRSAPASTPRRRSKAAAASPVSDARRPAFAASELDPADRVIPLTPLRRLVAEHMVYSKQTSPHTYTVAEIDLAGVARVRDAHKAAFQKANGFSLSYLPFVVHAAVRALREYPALNASFVDDAIVEKQAIHMGIAVETEKGLVVPVVRHADRLSLAGLAQAVEDLASRARSKQLSPDELKGGTFTISNPGRHGNLYGFAIINQPQVGILRMGEIVKRPVVREVAGEDAIVIRPQMHLALSYDHRVVDGAPANGFLHRIRELLEAAEFDL
jgi:2-oxoglutarate dehydrogenase E2 component (dihydrolipoamide succinyltransferase)